MWTYNYIAYPDELYHYGVPGMKWGVRKRRETFGPRINLGRNRAYSKERYALNKPMRTETNHKVKTGRLSKRTDVYKAKRAKYIKIGVAVAGTALAVYGAYKLNKYVKSTNFKYHQEIGEKIYNDYIKNSKLAVRAHTLYQESAIAGVGSRASERSYKAQQVLSRNALDRRASEIAKANTDNFVTAARNTYNYRKKHR